jgi:hypothetical protein
VIDKMILAAIEVSPITLGVLFDQLINKGQNEAEIKVAVLRLLNQEKIEMTPQRTLISKQIKEEEQ